ncbi:hypothetical protein CIB48_g4364 [Xylaria polymorpha]|nr:hypothetical protein CIB48_g4364 [Xylaria polymorpha]
MCQNIKGNSPYTLPPRIQRPSFEHDTSSESSKRNPSRKPVQQSWWWWEISAAGLSLLGTSLIVALLSNIDGLPLNSWMLPIQPNSVLAILTTTTTKTSLLVPVTACIGQLKWRHFILQPRPLLDQLQKFDNASRGSWGSAMLLYLLIFRVRSLIVLFLAATTLLELGIESSAHQIISFESKEVKVANRTVLATRTEAYFLRT